MTGTTKIITKGNTKQIVNQKSKISKLKNQKTKNKHDINIKSNNALI